MLLTLLHATVALVSLSVTTMFMVPPPPTGEGDGSATADVSLPPPGPLESLPAAATKSRRPADPPVSTGSDQPVQATPESDAPVVVAPTPAGLPPARMLRAPDPEVDALLDRLEAAGRDLTGFRSKITVHKWDGALERREIRAGEFIYQAIPGTPDRRFAALFDSVVRGTRKDNDLQHIIFAEGWFVEIDHARKQWKGRQVVAPGDIFDPLRLGEGPFPLPIGQAKQDVLRRFEVTRGTMPTKGLLKNLKDVDAVMLVPRPGTQEAQKYKSVALYYDRSTLLPIGIEALGAEAIIEDDEGTRDRTTVWLREIERNPTFDEATLKKIDITTPPGTEWAIDAQPWSRASAG